MKTFSGICLAFLLMFACRTAGQEPASSDEFAPLVLVRIIPMPDVEGRFDHMGVDPKSNRVFAAVYGNDSVEVLDVARGKRIQSIHAGFSKPQMAMYLPDQNRIVVSSEGDGSCKILDGETYKVVDTVKFPDDADQLRYDPATKRVYVGYGDGAIGMFDATTNKRIEGDFELGATLSRSSWRKSGLGFLSTSHRSARLRSSIEIPAKSRNGSSKKQEQTSPWRSMKRITACLLQPDDRRAFWCWIRIPAKSLRASPERRTPMICGTTPRGNGFTCRAAKASSLSTSKSTRTATSELPKFPARLEPALACIPGKLGNTTASTFRFLDGRTRERSCGFTKRGIDASRLPGAAGASD
jgi:hypothetical protein